MRTRDFRPSLGPSSSRNRLTLVVPVLDQGANTTVKTLLKGLDPRISTVLVDATADGDPRGRVQRAVDRLPGARRLDVTDRAAGPGHRRSEAIALALTQLDTDWVTVVDAGDFVVPGFHAAVLDAAVAVDAPLVGFNHTRVRGPVRVPESSHPTGAPTVREPAWRGLLGRGNRVGRLWSQLVHRSALEAVESPWLDPRLHHGAVVRLGWQLHLAAARSAAVTVPGYFRVNDHTTDDSPEALVGRVRAYQHAVDAARDHVHSGELVPEAVGAALRAVVRQARAEAEAGRRPSRQLVGLSEEIRASVGRRSLSRAWSTLDAAEQRLITDLPSVA
ncbi:hypothetical protein [Auraticoccus monumenti]|uniref:Glycosyl transferase family 2 n=1 Tax=Auraticoccus monumenti TaxID=675864 RepID=A0A1G7B6T8_9ACTN|nr:hypothetical protein [Auraticoccus monumenti]SDE22723.1 hypothetical protein SAMN04489747_2860 [Auraticoccus monumenti]